MVSLLTLGLLFIPSTHAFWRLPCAQPVLNARVDPIVAPGVPSSHTHSIAGSSAIGYSTTFNDLITSNCTTCMVNDDKSAYWVPELFYQYANGSFDAVGHGGMVVYYLQRNGPNETVQPFPDGLRMLTGDPYARNYTGTPESQAISWLCLNYNLPAQPQTPGFTTTNCPDGLRAQVFFPGCWDGVNLDSPNHKSHMAYPSGIDNGQCPPDHPVHLISIFFEVWFSVAPFNALNDGGRFVLANGDSTGHGLHGDFMDGWNKDVLSRAIQTCTDGSGVIENCPVFANENRFVPDAVMNSCAAPNPKPSENVQGPIPYLPGCVAVTDGPAEASSADLDPGCLSGSGNPVPVSNLPQNSSSSSMPASSSPASPPPSTTPASGYSSVPSSSSSMPPSSSPANPPPNTTPSSGDDSTATSSSSMPAYSSPASPPPSATHSSSYNSVSSSSGSMPAYSSPANPPNTTPPSGDDSTPSSSMSTPLPTEPPSSNSGSSPSSNTPAPSSVTPPNPMTSNPPAPVNPTSSSNDSYNGNGSPSPSSGPSPNSSPSSSPTPGSPASTNPGAVPPTTSTTQPSSTPPKEPAHPSSSLSSNGSSGNYYDHHSHKHHDHHPQQQQQDDNSDGDYCSGHPRAATRKARDARRPMRRRHHARRARHGSYMQL
ncbi:hypothetical protein EI94DRAFT_1701775 [Lactarius quietus]|nr:hypothetical protein EI94DRAFT_1701775 [Lactarius quietus]